MKPSLFPLLFLICISFCLPACRETTDSTQEIPSFDARSDRRYDSRSADSRSEDSRSEPEDTRSDEVMGDVEDTRSDEVMEDVEDTETDEILSDTEDTASDPEETDTPDTQIEDTQSDDTLTEEPEIEEDMDQELFARLVSFTPETVIMQPLVNREFELALDLPVDFEAVVGITYSGDEISGPDEVAIPVGSTWSVFSVFAREVSEDDIVITAAYDGVELTATVTVYEDSDPPFVTEVMPEFQKVGKNNSTAVGVYLNHEASVGGTEVYIDNTQVNGLFTISDTVTVPEGELFVEIPLQAGNSTGTAMISAYTGYESSGFPSATIQVVSSFPQGLFISQLLYDPIHSDDEREWVVLYNTTGSSVDLTGFQLRYASTSQNNNFSSSFEQYNTPLSELIIPVGGCVVIGGPVSDEGNGSPVYDYEVDLGGSSNLGNATGNAEGAVALFDDSGLIVHAVIYGGDGDTSIQDETGSSEVDISSIEPGQAVYLKQNGAWEAGEPEPGYCGFR